ncbi:MAG: hypothetical protein BJ554DRAFT_7592, partial [Olpidium bornovanus]
SILTGGKAGDSAPTGCRHNTRRRRTRPRDHLTPTPCAMSCACSSAGASLSPVSALLKHSGAPQLFTEMADVLVGPDPSPLARGVIGFAPVNVATFFRVEWAVALPIQGCTETCWRTPGFTLGSEGVDDLMVPQHLATEGRLDVGVMITVHHEKESRRSVLEPVSQVSSSSSRSASRSVPLLELARFNDSSVE